MILFFVQLLYFCSCQTPEVLYTLVNLARLSLADTLLGPVQGEELEARLRLDTLCTNGDAPPPPSSPASQKEPHQDEENMHTQPKHEQDPMEQLSLGNDMADAATPDQEVPPQSGARCFRRTTAVPAERLPEIRDQVRKGVHISRRLLERGMRGGSRGETSPSKQYCGKQKWS